MNSTKRVIQALLAEAEITVNGPNPWDITVHNENFYGRIAAESELGLGESYMDSEWDCSQLDQFFYRLFSANIENKALSNPLFWRAALKQSLYEIFRKLLNHQTKAKSFIVGRKHYDIGNDLYEAMLDKRLVYTCAFWMDDDDLDAAQERKLHVACRKLDLQPGMILLDVGCGWGSLAQYAAQNFGVSVVGMTVSKAQLALAQARCKGLPVEIRLQDYRELLNSSQRFDRIASLGMFEHVGIKNYPIYMRSIAHSLKEDGIFLLHTIGTNTLKKVSSRWIDTYIFPNGEIPSITSIAKASERIFVMEDWANYGVHYDKTLMAWHHNFNQHWDELKTKYNERFRRMWNYYLLSSAGSFRARQTQLWQVVFSKNGLTQGYPHSVASFKK